ncbi:unnamed protein product [Caretta caretta]
MPAQPQKPPRGTPGPCRMPTQPDRSTPPTNTRMNQPAIPLMLLERPHCKTVPAASGNITQVLTSRRPDSPSHVAKQISILRRLSATLPPVQHVTVPRRISAPPHIAAQDPVARRASTAPQTALQTPTARATPQTTLRSPAARGPSAKPQTALRAPATGGANTMPQIALQTPEVTGGTSPAATPKHQAFIARWPSAAPKSILQDTAYGRFHAPAATAQAAATHRRTSGVPATPEPDRISPTTSNASIPPEIPPQHPTEGNPDPRDRWQADHTGFEPAPDKVEVHEGQQPMVRAATPWQTAWTEELQVAASFDDFGLLVDRLT